MLMAWRKSKTLGAALLIIVALIQLGGHDGHSQSLLTKLNRIQPICISNSQVLSPRNSTSVVEDSTLDPSIAVLIAVGEPTQNAIQAPPTEAVIETEENANTILPPSIDLVKEDDYQVDWSRYRQVSSSTTVSGAYFDVDFGSVSIINPNILPHPSEPDHWIVVARKQEMEAFQTNYTALACTAHFVNGSLVCISAPTPLSINETVFCEGDPNYGPQDPRMFYGPDTPFLLYGADSAFSCRGMWLQELQPLWQDITFPSSNPQLFNNPTDIQRPPPYGHVEKNYFVFWDLENNTYIHQDISRVFTKLEADGSVGPNLALEAASKDTACIQKYLPKLGTTHFTVTGYFDKEGIHQATNSLSITLCRRHDPECHPTKENTFVMTMFQHKIYHEKHGEYHPYVMLFQQVAPFAIHSISKKAIWINGRTTLTAATNAAWWRGQEDQIPKAHSEQFFVTSISWKAHGQKYHGYIDDELFVGFGIEDTRAGAIDVVAGDLLQDLGHCLSGD